MTIDKAMQTLTDQLRYFAPDDSTPLHEALKLAIEALKRLNDNRRDPEFDHWIPLPRETDDDDV
jgi:Mg-chelatase subunit ChlD